jgi:hypothetical protein
MKGFIAEFAPASIPAIHETLYGTQSRLQMLRFINEIINNGIEQHRNTPRTMANVFTNFVCFIRFFLSVFPDSPVH